MLQTNPDTFRAFEKII